MEKRNLILSSLVLWTLTPAWAQLYPPNKAGVSLGAWHTIVRDVETTKKWWELWGGTPIKIDGVDVMKFHGVFVFMMPGKPNRPSKGALIDHIAFQTPKGFDLMKKLVEAGVKTDPINLTTMREPNWKPGSDQRTWNDTYSPDGLKVEVETDEEAVEKNDLNVGIHSDMIHFYFKDLADQRISYKWYRKYFGGRPEQDPNVNLHIPGTKVNFGVDYDGVTRPLNRGGALDYIGFEVRHLDTFCKRMEADGVKFDQPYSKTRHKSYASAMLTGPAGEVIELTEGLNKF